MTIAWYVNSSLHSAFQNLIKIIARNMISVAILFTEYTQNFTEWSVWPEMKGKLDPEINILQTFTHPHVVPKVWLSVSFSCV